MQGRRGFTLIELMVVVAIIAILAALAMPMYANLAAHAQSASTKGNLGTLRTSITLYTGDHDGVPPGQIADLIPQYLSRIPTTYTPGLHPPSANAEVSESYSGDSSMQCIPLDAETYAPDAGGWLYRDPNWFISMGSWSAGACQPGTVVVNCSHQDERGVVWADY